jgi:hypothetical protein
MDNFQNYDSSNCLRYIENWVGYLSGWSLHTIPVQHSLEII